MAKRSNSKRKVIPEAQTRDDGILSTEFVLPGWKLVLIHAAIIVAAGLWIYSPALHGDWLGDDDLYIYKNPLMNDPARLWKVWFQPGGFIEYYPLEETVQWVQWQLWGNDTFGYHLTNVCLHLLSAFLVWRLLIKFGLQLAWLGGLIFVIHPMMVESVAWISELKNCLSLPPFLLAMCAWIDYEERGRRADYLWALAYFLVAMLCKISVAPFPVVILLYAWWRRGRIGWRDLLAGAPFLVTAVTLVLINLWSSLSYIHSQLNIPSVVEIGGFFSRFALAGQTLSYYFTMCFWPVGPLPYYPQWKVDPSSLVQFLPWLVLSGAACWLWRRRQSWGRHGLLGLGFFILNLGPFLGFIPISYMNYTWIMDHFLYVPIIGLIGIVVAGIERVDARLSASVHPFSTGILTVIMGLLAFESHWYAAAFTGEETLWNYTVDRNPEAWAAHDNLGKVLLRVGEPDQAKEHFDTAIRLKPEISEPYCNLASAYMQMGRIPEASQALLQALKKDPNDPVLHNNMGILLAQTGHIPEALGQFEQALRGHPFYAEAHDNMGHTLLLAGRTSEAIEQFQAALQINPSDDKARQNLDNLRQFEMQRTAPKKELTPHHG